MNENRSIMNQSLKLTFLAHPRACHILPFFDAVCLRLICILICTVSGFKKTRIFLKKPNPVGFIGGFF